MDTINYHYSQGDLLENPQNYSYSAYSAKAFIDAWLSNRKSHLDLLPPAEKLEQRNGESLRPKNTNNLLHAICERLQQPQVSIDRREMYWLKRLVKKFEVTKRVYSAYQASAPYRPMDKTSYNDMALYLKLAECFILAYNQGGEMQFLNAFIKIQDSIISQVNSLDHISQTHLAWLIQQEVKVLQVFMTDKGLA
jgi:hypothetical protein